METLTNGANSDFGLTCRRHCPCSIGTCIAVRITQAEDQTLPETCGCSLWLKSLPKLGRDAVLAKIPNHVRYYVTIDIDGFDPSIAPGTGTPSHGGFEYYEVLEILQGLVEKGDVVGIDLVEVAPDYDPTGSTAFLAAQLLMNFLGFIYHTKGKSA
jgi:arginase family enzyme